ncbi:MAG: hypothetical protein H7318_03395 [Oligoflexus sp.]|nr:hypothetical protein [Oligoflexus sp.]
MPFEVTASQKDQTLPMILTLRGDEAIVDEFSYDTDQAMAYLGIKRSRLNQISGRELRVARIRRDRYIRPVFRECDLKDYLDWTRATATHLSSSKAIEQAVENLDDRFNDVLQVFNEKLLQVSQEQQGWMKGEFERLPSKLQNKAIYTTEVELEKPLHREDKLLRSHGDKLSTLRDDVLTLQIKLRELTGIVTLVLPEIRELNVGQKALRFDFDQRFEGLNAELRDLRVSLAGFGARHEVFIEDLRELVTPVVVEVQEELPEPSPLKMPKRQRAFPQLAKRRYGA